MKTNLNNQARNRLEALTEEFADRQRAGDTVSIEDYVFRNPELANEIRELFPLVVILDIAGKKSNSRQEATYEIDVGTQLGESQLSRLIGRGGMGVVYLNLDRNREARDVLSELAQATKSSPKCFKWLEKRVAADLNLTQ